MVVSLSLSSYWLSEDESFLLQLELFDLQSVDTFLFPFLEAFSAVLDFVACSFFIFSLPLLF